MRTRAVAVLVLACVSVVGACSAEEKAPVGDAVAAEADRVRALEKDRINALLTGDAGVARDILADDYQLVDPVGDTWSRDEYINSVGAGELDYLTWDPDSPMVVRMHGDAAVVRYSSSIVVSLNGNRISGRFWLTELYENRDGRWQAVWSQTTQVI